MSKATDYLENIINSFGPDDGIELTQTSWEQTRGAILELLKERVAQRPEAGATVRFGMNQDGTLDELFASGARFHIEQMSATHWWMEVECGKKRIHVNLHSKATIKANVLDEGEEPSIPMNNERQ